MSSENPSFVETYYVRYHIGKTHPRVLVDAVHAKFPDGEVNTGRLVDEVVDRADCSGIVARVSRKEADLNRPFTDENKSALRHYRGAVYNILHEGHLLDDSLRTIRPFLHIALHGMHDIRNGPDIVLGTRKGRVCDPVICEWLSNLLEQDGYKVAVDRIFPGSSGLEYFRSGVRSKVFTGYGQNYHVVQLELSRELRRNRNIDRTVEMISQIIESFHRQSFEYI